MWPGQTPVHERGKVADWFDAYFAGELVCTSREPLFDGARVLLACGRSPDTLLTSVHRLRFCFTRSSDFNSPINYGQSSCWSFVLSILPNTLAGLSAHLFRRLLDPKFAT